MEKSAVAEHVWEKHHPIDWEETQCRTMAKDRSCWWRRTCTSGWHPQRSASTGMENWKFLVAGPLRWGSTTTQLSNQDEDGRTKKWAIQMVAGRCRNFCLQCAKNAKPASPSLFGGSMRPWLHLLRGNLLPSGQSSQPSRILRESHAFDTQLTLLRIQPRFSRNSAHVVSYPGTDSCYGNE